MVNTLGRGNHQPVTTGQSEMLKRPFKKRSSGRSRLLWSIKKKTPQPTQQKRKKTVQALTLAEPLVPSVLSLLENSDISEFSDAESDFSEDERTVSTCANKTNNSERTVIESFDKTNSSKPSPWDVDSYDLNLEQWKTQKGKRSLKEVPRLTYKMSLKGPAPGPSAKLLEHKFVKRNNIVKR
jgi:hypothetical protein